MTVAGYQNAKDEMFKLLNDAWDAGAAAIVGYVPDINWPLNEPAVPTDLSRYWATVSTQMVLEDQAALGNVENSNQKVYESAGILFVQCFGPMAGDPTVTTKLPALAALAKNSFRGMKTPSGVWFRNVRTRELGPDGKFQRINAIAEFQYREIGI